MKLAIAGVSASKEENSTVRLFVLQCKYNDKKHNSPHGIGKKLFLYEITDKMLQLLHNWHKTIEERR